jgi:hypothetical protein
MHFVMKLFLAAPCSGLPSALTALLPQVSRLHLRTKLIFAAPWSALPLAPTAWLSQDCAAAVPTAKHAINNAGIRRFIGLSLRFVSNAEARCYGREVKRVANWRLARMLAGFAYAGPIISRRRV